MKTDVSLGKELNYCVITFKVMIYIHCLSVLLHKITYSFSWTEVHFCARCEPCSFLLPGVKCRSIVIFTITFPELMYYHPVVNILVTG